MAIIKCYHQENFTLFTFIELQIHHFMTRWYPNKLNFGKKCNRIYWWKTNLCFKGHEDLILLVCYMCWICLTQYLEFNSTLDEISLCIMIDTTKLSMLLTTIYIYFFFNKQKTISHMLSFQTSLVYRVYSLFKMTNYGLLLNISMWKLDPVTVPCSLFYTKWSNDEQSFHKCLFSRLYTCYYLNDEYSLQVWGRND